ncbi:alanine/glycine:cation symporter family protein [Chlamydia psittaci]|uniref:alanine/glycine:cation symporter family protein n=1 Tax=Chlamydia psittaci TaxID=83554 RepID=UPI00027E1DA8|nr:amino acid carrier protein [Chlamydia psittaci]AFS22174.1 amino acid carrier family protein [Chlamydia psittaci MN]AFS27398.1 amino acid carrier family protein [Chlamydia psittaci CP3]KPZ36949.1 cytochrome C551 [Chlamydia psittaci CP3]KPZ38947.1 cytochrome C551 [Chlamydia psittaci str. Frances]MBE3636460.1 sodium:alanine symporter family protein [Chlamydia psittaci]
MLHFLEQLNNFCISFCVFPTILFLGGLLTWKLRGLQFTGLKLGFNLMLKNKQENLSTENGTVSRYEAVAGILAGNFGTGNIAGMAVAIACGGPGALVWIWVAALLGAIVQYSGSFLGVKYRKLCRQSGKFIGGPTGCLAYGLGSKFLAGLFCIFTIITAFSAGNFAQINCIVPLCVESVPLKFLVGVFLALTIVPVLIGGNSRILRFSARVIPFIAGFYAISCLIILIQHSSMIIPALKLIVSSSLGIKATVAGLGGYTVTQVISTGMSRAIMATDCGSGMVSILQSDSQSKNPVIDGLVTLLPPVIVMIVCSITTLVLIVSGAYISGQEGTLMVLNAFKSSLGSIGGLVVILAMALFGYTTVLTWFACAEKSLEYMIPGKRANSWLKILFVAVIPFGGIVDMRLIWSLSDTGFAGMVILNSIALVALFKDVLSTHREVALLRLEEDAQPTVLQNLDI